MALIDVLSAAIARLVPLLLLASATLVVGRLAYDRYLSAGTIVARGLFAGVGVVGVLLATPYALRSGSLLAAQAALVTGDWDAAERWFARHEELAPERSRTVIRQRATTLLHLGRWSDAERVLLAGVEREEAGHVRIAPYDVYLLGICRYFEGRFAAASKALLAVRREPTAELVDYYLGRLAERDGRVAEAAADYRSSLRRWPRFLPAAYQLARLDGALGVDAAQDVLPRLAGDDHSPAMAGLRAAIRRGARLPPLEFPFAEAAS